MAEWIPKEKYFFMLSNVLKTNDLPPINKVNLSKNNSLYYVETLFSYARFETLAEAEKEYKNCCDIENLNLNLKGAF